MVVIVFSFFLFPLYFPPIIPIQQILGFKPPAERKWRRFRYRVRNKHLLVKKIRMFQTGNALPAILFRRNHTRSQYQHTRNGEKGCPHRCAKLLFQKLNHRPPDPLSQIGH